MKYCSNCGTQIPDDQSACPKCGFGKPKQPEWIIKKLIGIHKINYIYNIVSMSYTFLYMILSLIFYIEKKTDPTCWINISLCIVGSAILIGNVIVSIIAYLDIKKNVKDNPKFVKMYILFIVLTIIALCLLLAQPFVIYYTTFKLAVMSGAAALILLDVFAATEKIWAKYYNSYKN